MPCSGGSDALFWLLRALHTDAHTHTLTHLKIIKKKKLEKKNPFIPLCLQRGLGSSQGLTTTFIASSPVLTLLGHPVYQGHIGDTDSRF